MFDNVEGKEGDGVEDDFKIEIELLCYGVGVYLRELIKGFL